MRFKHEQLTAARDRLSNYLHDVDARLDRDAVGDRCEELHEYCVELQARTLELKASLEVCGRRLAVYSAQVPDLETSR